MATQSIEAAKRRFQQIKAEGKARALKLAEVKKNNPALSDKQAAEIVHRFFVLNQK